MNRTRKVAVGLGAAAALLAGGIAVAVPALAQTDPAEPDPLECPYECPLDRDQMRDQTRARMHEQLQDRDGTGPNAIGGMPQHHGYGPGGGTCQLAPDAPDSND